MEIIGLVSTWVVLTILICYITAFLIGTFVKGGLEVIALMNVVIIAILVISAVSGIFVLGTML